MTDLQALVRDLRTTAFMRRMGEAIALHSECDAMEVAAKELERQASAARELLKALQQAAEQLVDAGHDGNQDDAACRALQIILPAIAKAPRSESVTAAHLGICASQDDTMPGHPNCDCGAGR